MRKLVNLALLTAFIVVLAASPAVAKKAPVERIVVDGVSLAQVKPSTQVEPYYPATARPTKMYAQVILAAEVTAKGKVGQVDVVAASVEGLGFEDSARDAVKAWRFHPALENDLPIDSVTVIRLTFTPPTMRRPDGFVLTERSPRLFLAQMFEEIFEQRTWTKAFKEGAGLAASQDEFTFYPSDVPPCNATRGGSDCIYNKQDLIQFGGIGQTVGLPPSNVRPPDTGLD